MPCILPAREDGTASRGRHGFRPVDFAVVRVRASGDDGALVHRFDRAVFSLLVSHDESFIEKITKLDWLLVQDDAGDTRLEIKTVRCRLTGSNK